MEVVVKLNMSLKHQAFEGPGEIRVLLPEGSGVDDLLGRLGLVREKVGLVLVNGQLVYDNTTLREKDVVALYPVWAGG